MKKFLRTLFCTITIVLILGLGLCLINFYSVFCHRGESFYFSDESFTGEPASYSAKVLPRDSVYEEVQEQIPDFPWRYLCDKEKGPRNLIAIYSKLGYPQWEKGTAYSVREDQPVMGNCFHKATCEISLTAKNNDLHVVFFHGKFYETETEVGYTMRIKNHRISLTNITTNEAVPLRDYRIEGDTVNINVCAFELYKPRRHYETPWEEEQAYKYEETKTVYKYIVNNRTICVFISSSICGAFEAFRGDFFEIKYRGDGDALRDCLACSFPIWIPADDDVFRGFRLDCDERF